MKSNKMGTNSPAVAILAGWAAMILFVAAAAAGEVRGFTGYDGTWLVRDGGLLAESAAGSKLVYDGAEFDVGEVGVEMRLPPAGDGCAGLIVKVSEPDIGADRFVGYEIALDANRQVVRLARHRQNFELLREAPCEVPLDRWLPLVVTTTATRLEVRVNGATVLSYEDADHPLPPGRIGLRPWQRPAEFRRLWISPGGRRQEIGFQAGWDGADPELPALATDRLPPIAFITRQPLSAPPAVGQDLWAAQPRGPGCSIRVLDPRQPQTPAKILFEDPAGCIYDLNVSNDARTLYFSYRPGGERYWHLWRIGTDGTGLKQLTDGPFYDVSPCEMPDGRLIFVSTRRFGYTLCQPGPASNLHVLDPAGGPPRCVSMNTLSDLTPQMLPDGRVLFTRWEYIDRDLTFRQSLWTQYPDGTVYQLFFGNTIRDVGTFWQARPLPGRSDRVVATFAPHHGHPHGAIGLIDRNLGPEGEKGRGFVYLTKDVPQVGDQEREWSYRDPFPLSDETLLCAYGGGVGRFRLLLMDFAGHRRLLYEDPAAGCYFPVALRPVAVPARLSQRVAAPAANAMPAGGGATGVVLLSDVSHGLEPVVGRGRVAALRVMEQVRKTEDLVARAYDQSPVMSYGTYYAKRNWGTVPVEPDGSAHFTVPALREIYFQALDAEGRELQRMTSAVQVMPGEVVSCAGCHESRQHAPAAPTAVPLAAQHPPRDLVRPAWGKDGIIDFPTVVQPVLDRYCVSCHQGGAPAGGYDLSGDKTRFFNMAYDNLLGRSRSYRQHDMATGIMLPEEAAKPKPLVHFNWLLRTPTAVTLPLATGSHASRLTELIGARHGGRTLPADARQRIYAWIDANVPYYGTYAHGRPLSPGRRDRWSDPVTGRPAEWWARDFGGIYQRRCAECHGGLETTTDWEGRYAWLNLTRPASSPALTAHLSKRAGGRQLAAPANGRVPPPFTDPGDPDYQAMLRALERGSEEAHRTPEPDQPGFAGLRPEP